MKAYIPVSCGFVDRIEDAATRKTSGEVVFAENGVKKSVLGQIKTWENVNKEEFVVLEDGTRIRMDKVVSLFGVPGPAHKLWHALSIHRIRITHFTFLIILDAFFDLFLVVHHKRAVGIHGFIERFAA